MDACGIVHMIVKVSTGAAALRAYHMVALSASFICTHLLSILYAAVCCPTSCFSLIFCVEDRVVYDHVANARNSRHTHLYFDVVTLFAASLSHCRSSSGCLAWPFSMLLVAELHSQMQRILSTDAMTAVSRHHRHALCMIERRAMFPQRQWS